MSAVTEQQARSRVCVNDPGTYCLGTVCMAWRWFDTGREFAGPVPIKPPAERRGYCGMAGAVGFNKE